MEGSARERVLRVLYGAAMGTRPWSEALDRVALVISDPNRPSWDMTDRLIQCYRMTASEAGLVSAVVQGTSLRA